MAYPSKEQVIAGVIAIGLVVGAVLFGQYITEGNGRPQLAIERKKAIERKESEPSRIAAEEYERAMELDKPVPEVVPAGR